MGEGAGSEHVRTGRYLPLLASFPKKYSEKVDRK